MTTFKEREEGFEKMFAHDEEMRLRPTRGATSCLDFGPPENWD